VGTRGGASEESMVMIILIEWIKIEYLEYTYIVVSELIQLLSTLF
jgi:hypothetical protein